MLAVGKMNLPERVLLARSSSFHVRLIASDWPFSSVKMHPSPVIDLSGTLLTLRCILINRATHCRRHLPPTARPFFPTHQQVSTSMSIQKGNQRIVSSDVHSTQTVFRQRR
jgi:hypothetical protein